MKPLVIYHGKCADGFTAAWAAWRFIGDTDYHPGVYGQQPPDVAGRDVVMLDFSYKRAVLEAMGESARSILILDHHKTAQADLETFAIFNPVDVHDIDEIVPATQPGLGNIRAIFDMGRSGAQIAWNFYFPNTARPLLVDYVGDRDLWQFKLPHSREVNAYVFANEYTFANWDDLDLLLDSRASVLGVAEMGAAIEKKHHKDVAELVEVTRRTMRIGGIDMPVANIPYTLTSDAGNLMAKQDHGVAACYWDTPTGRVFSLRSTESGPDVSAIAAGYGGGGHKNAAGFQKPLGWEGDARE
jgi:oligoribonuclease NrnB/cAMP/cGMP phosphodiesterase (DHH superfamily)